MKENLSRVPDLAFVALSCGVSLEFFRGPFLLLSHKRILSWDGRRLHNGPSQETADGESEARFR